MKLNNVMLLFAMAIGILFGFICRIVASEEGSREWISLIVTAITVSSAMIAAIAMDYENKGRGISMKVLGWVMALLLVVSNFLFSCFTYNIDAYIAINLLILVIGWLAIFGLVKLKR
jgi:hypothetical protein